MPLPFKKQALSAGLGAALATGTPTVAADDVKQPPMKTVEEQIKELQGEIKLLKEQKKELTETLHGPADGKGTPSEIGVLKRLEKAEADMKKMAEAIDELKSKLATRTVVEKTPISPGKGKVVLVNEFRTKLSIMVNNVSYPLEPNEVKELQVDAGKFTYELVEFPNASMVKSDIKEGETVTLRIK